MEQTEHSGARDPLDATDDAARALFVDRERQLEAREQVFGPPCTVKRRTSRATHAHAAFASDQRLGLNKVWVSSMAQATRDSRSPTLRRARARSSAPRPR